MGNARSGWWPEPAQRKAEGFRLRKAALAACGFRLLLQFPRSGTHRGSENGKEKASYHQRQEHGRFQAGAEQAGAGGQLSAGLDSGWAAWRKLAISSLGSQSAAGKPGAVLRTVSR